MKKYVVKQGETIYHVAQRYGHEPDHLWMFQKNEHLRQENRRKNILFPGDIVRVPDINVRRESASTERRHTYRVKSGPLTQIRLRLLFESEPRKDARCTLLINEAHIPRTEIESKTDSDGIVEFDVPSQSTNGLLQVENDEAYQLRFNYLNPINETSGVQQRLASLGFAPGPIDGIVGPLTRGATREFQREVRATIDGIVGPETRKHLDEEYGC